MFSSRERADGFLKMANLFQQLLHDAALVVPGYRVVQRLPQPFNVIHPR